MSGTTSSPTGWSVARLEDLFETITDGDHQAPPQVEEGVPFLVIGNVRTSRIDFTDVRFVPDAYYQALAEHRKPARGDLLYTVTGSLGIPALVDTDRSFCVQRHIAMLKPARETNARYLFHALATTATFQQATKAATGTAQKTLGLASLRTITVPVAPAEEQVRIVDALDSYLSRLDAALATLEAAQTKLRAYRASVLKAAVEGRLIPAEAALARAEKRDFEPAEVLLKRILSERRQRWEEKELAKLKAASKSLRDDKWKAKYEEPEPPDAKDLPELPQGWCWASVDQVGDVLLGRQTRLPDHLTGRWSRPYRRDANIKDDRVPTLRSSNVRHLWFQMRLRETNRPAHRERVPPYDPATRRRSRQ
jgi:type I restriction enzyme S subunit